MQLTTTANYFFLSRPATEASLRIDRRTGAIRELVLETSLGVASTRIECVLGICRLVDSQYLLTVPEGQARSVVQLGASNSGGGPHGSHEVFRVGRVELTRFHDDAFDQDTINDAQYLRLIKSALNSGSFYFSPTYDITNSAQRLSQGPTQAEEHKSADTAPSPASAWTGADDRFIWNRHLCQPFFDQAAESWVSPIIDGYVTSDSIPFGPDSTAQFILFSRRSARHAGTRFNTRGVTPSGNAANFVELEQMIVVTSPRSNRDAESSDVEVSPTANFDGLATSMASFVQTRGSVPLIWRQRPDLSYTPRPFLVGSDDDAKEAYGRHFTEQVELYGRQVVVNLLNQHGRESQLYNTFTSTALNEKGAVQNDSFPPGEWINYRPFDFHQECKKLRFDNIYKLVNEISHEFQQMGYFFAERTSSQPGAEEAASFCPLWSTAAGWSVLSTQKSVIRTNCLDNLDRSNVVQSVFARVALKTQLERIGVSRSLVRPSPSDDAPPNFAVRLERSFRNVWANNADVLSVRYAGTNALKTDFTRTGKRTYLGLVYDGISSLYRYYLNNFRDGERQDSIDLLLGNFDPPRDHPVAVAKNGGNSSGSNSNNISRRNSLASSSDIANPLNARYPDPLSGGISGLISFCVRVWWGAASIAARKSTFKEVCENLVDMPLLCAPGGIPKASDADEARRKAD